MEDVGAVLVHVDAIDFFRVDVASDMIAAVDNQAGFADLGGLMSKNGARDACANDKVVVMAALHTMPFCVERFSWRKASPLVCFEMHRTGALLFILNQHKHSMETVPLRRLPSIANAQQHKKRP